MPSERRKNPRMGLAIPLRVRGFLPEGETWEELTTTGDVSAGGACFSLTHEVELGQALRLALPLPRRLRQFDHANPEYEVYALVRGVRRRPEQPRVGVMFFGQQPPRGFAENPSARFLLPTDSLVNAPVPRGLREGRQPPAEAPSASAAAENGFDPHSLVPPELDDSAHTPPALFAPSTLLPRKVGVPRAPVPGERGPAFVPPRDPSDRRGELRVERFVNFTIQLVDEWGAVLQEELTVADNVARGGARVMTSLPFERGDVLLLQEAGGAFGTRAEVRAVTRAQQGVARLHLRFLDRSAPDRLLKQ
jgi:hypothetical protein